MGIGWGDLSVKRVQLTFSLSASPPGVAPTMTVCPCCDYLWNQIHHQPVPLRSYPSAAFPQSRNASFIQQSSSVVRTMPPISGSTGTIFASTVSNYLSSRPPPQPSRAVDHGSGGRDLNSVVAPLCMCNLQCRIAVTSKEGSNKGRQFFACHKTARSGLSSSLCLM